VLTRSLEYSYLSHAFSYRIALAFSGFVGTFIQHFVIIRRLSPYNCLIRPDNLQIICFQSRIRIFPTICLDVLAKFWHRVNISLLAIASSGPHPASSLQPVGATSVRAGGLPTWGHRQASPFVASVHQPLEFTAQWLPRLDHRPCVPQLCLTTSLGGH
jgi:hypothetical protein